MANERDPDPEAPASQPYRTVGTADPQFAGILWRDGGLRDRERPGSRHQAWEPRLHRWKRGGAMRKIELTEATDPLAEDVKQIEGEAIVIT